MSIFWAGAFFVREDARDEDGMFMPFIFTPLTAPLFCVVLLLAAVDLDLDLGLLLGLLPMFMPGMFCMSCCAQAGAAATTSRPAMAIVLTFERKINLKLFMIPSRIVLLNKESLATKTAPLYSVQNLILFCERRCALQLSSKPKLGRGVLNKENADENVSCSCGLRGSVLSRGYWRSK